MLLKFLPFLLLLLWAFPSEAASRFLVFSGGGAPSLNHYSQYLQTKLLAVDLMRRFPGRVSVFFGAGNSPRSPRLLPDVHKKRAGEPPVDEMLYGVIPSNRMATKDAVR